MTLRLNLPNRITLARLGLAIVFFLLLIWYSQREPNVRLLDCGIIVFIVAALTDLLDGYIARSRGLVTPLGRVLDPFVDKVLVCGAFIFFAGPGFVDARGVNVTSVEAWMVVVIVGRELLVTGLRGFSESRGQSFAASLHGKMKMWVQCIAVPVILFSVGHPDNVISAGGGAKSFFVWLTVIVTTLSTLQYLARSRHILEESKPS